MTRKVFISHTVHDLALARKVCTVLEGSGVECKYRRDPRGATRVDAEIAEAIREASILVLLYTEQANEAGHVAREVAIAQETDTLIVPLRVSRSTPAPDIRCAFDRVSIDARVPPLDPHLVRLAEAIVLDLEPVEPPRPSGPRSVLYVGNLSFDTSEAEIEEAFEEYGTVRGVNVITDRETGRPRGFAFVEMGGSSEADAAVKALDGFDLAGRTLRVHVARPRETRGGGGGAAPADTGLRGGRRESRPMAREEAEAAGPEPAEQRPEADDRRLGVDVYLGDQELERAFVADQPNRIVVSIGHSARTRADEAIEGLTFDETDRRELWVSLAFEDPPQWQKIVVLRDPRSEASVEFSVLPTEPTFAATVVLYAEDKTTVLQAARLAGAVAPDLDTAARRRPSFSLQVIPVRALGATAPGAGASFVTDGDRAEVRTPHVRLMASAVTAQRLIKAFTNGLATPAGNHAAAGQPIDSTLVDAARFGSRMLSQLGGLEELRPLTRIQVVSLEANAIFPLELAYDGATPKAEAKLCDGWRESLLDGACAACDQAAPTADRTLTVCPLRFWGMSKVIEHHVAPTSADTAFVARAQRQDAASELPRLGSTLVGASERVLQETRAGRVDPLEPVLAAATRLGTVVQAANWGEWETAVQSSGPSVLVAMPHQGRDESDTFEPAILELAGDTESTFGETHVRKESEQPGPLVVLIGCDVAVQEDAIASFANDFRRYAPVVVSAIGKVIAFEAPKAAGAVLAALDRASSTRGETVGIALRNARRALLSESLLVGLQLVGHGDSDWPVQGGA